MGLKSQTIFSNGKPISLRINNRYIFSSSLPNPNFSPFHSLPFTSLQILKPFQNPSPPPNPNPDSLIVVDRNPNPNSLVANRNTEPDPLVTSRNPNLNSFITSRNPNLNSFITSRNPNLSSTIYLPPSSPETLASVICKGNPIPSPLVLDRIPNPNSFIVNRSPNLDSVVVGRNPFRPFSVRSALLSSSWFLESLSSVISSRKPNPNSHVVTRNTRNMPNLPHSLHFHYPSFSFSYSSSTNPNASSRISRSNPRQNHNSHSPEVNSDEFMEIIALVEGGGDDMQVKLNQMNPRLSVTSVSKILNLLNDRGVSALCFFNWVRKNRSDFNPNSEIYNQVINNTGLLEDYESMLVLLTELALKRHCLTEKAFGFLKVFSYDQVRIGNSVERIVEILNRVKGSCHNSGIYALIKTLCALNSFNLAIFVMEETARKRSYYHVLIAAKCRSGDFQEARDLFDEMKRFGCDPNTKSYNYLLGSLCKKEKIAEACELLEIMEILGYLPDSVTFEVIAFHACRLGRMDAAIEFLYQMMSEGLEPRITTHSAFIKGYFWSGQIQDAHKYVVEMSGKDKHSSNMNYTLLASLFQKSGRVVEAREILVEMIEKGLKPNFPVYMRVVKDLYKMGKGGLIADLKCRYLKFHPITVNR